MNKDIVSQLNKLKEVKPDYEWKKNNRAILASQIYSSQIKEVDWFDNFKKKIAIPTVAAITQPVVVVVLFIAVVFGGGSFGVAASKNTKPGDSLYGAKIAGEKTKLALTFNEKDKAKLRISFAGNRAKEIGQVLAESEIKNKSEKVEKLINNFNNEINQVKNELEKINVDASKKNDKKDKDNEEIKIEEEVLESKKEELEENGTVFSANLGKEEKGLQVGENNNAEPEKEGEDKVLDNNLKNNLEDKVDDSATTSVTKNIESTSTDDMITLEVKGDTELILEEAKKMLMNEDYSGTLSKLEEAGQAIAQVDLGEVKGEEDSATSTSNEIIKNIEDNDMGDESEILEVEETKEDFKSSASSTN